MKTPDNEVDDVKARIERAINIAEKAFNFIQTEVLKTKETESSPYVLEKMVAAYLLGFIDYSTCKILHPNDLSVLKEFNNSSIEGVKIAFEHIQSMAEKEISLDIVK